MCHTQTFDARKPQKKTKKEEEEKKTIIKQQKSVSLMHSPKAVKISPRQLCNFTYLSNLDKSSSGASSPVKLSQTIQELERRVMKNIEESQQIWDRSSFPSKISSILGKNSMKKPEFSDFVQSVEI